MVLINHWFWLFKIIKILEKHIETIGQYSTQYMIRNFKFWNGRSFHRSACKYSQWPIHINELKAVQTKSLYTARNSIVWRHCFVLHSPFQSWITNADMEVSHWNTQRHTAIKEIYWIFLLFGQRRPHFAQQLFSKWSVRFFNRHQK